MTNIRSNKFLLVFLFSLLYLLNFSVVVSAINLDVTKTSVNDVVVSELDEPAVFNLLIKNLGADDRFTIYSLVGVDITPSESFFIASGAAKDRDWSQRHPNKATVEVLTMANYDWFQEWSSEKCMNRSDEYVELKNKFRDKMLAEGFLKLYPNLHNRIKYMEVGTSVTLEHYLGTQKGEAYGLDPTPERFTLYPELRPRTKVKGLYLSGQDICTLGFTGSMMGGVLAAHSVLGYGTVMDMVTGRNLIDDLLKLEN